MHDAAFRTYESDPGEALRQLTEMADEQGMNDNVRLGDIYAILILHNVKRNNFRKVVACVPVEIIVGCYRLGR